MRVQLTGFRVEGVSIGIYAEELRQTQPVEVSLVLGLDAQAAIQSDEVADTADYAVLLARVAQLCRDRHYNLLETLTACLAERIVAEFPPVMAVYVTVVKLEAPVPARVSASVGRCRHGG